MSTADALFRLLAAILGTWLHFRQSERQAKAIETASAGNMEDLFMLRLPAEAAAEVNARLQRNQSVGDLLKIRLSGDKQRQ